MLIYANHKQITAIAGNILVLTYQVIRVIAIWHSGQVVIISQMQISVRTSAYVLTLSTAHHTFNHNHQFIIQPNYPQIIQMQYSQAIETGHRSKWTNPLDSPKMAQHQQSIPYTHNFDQRYAHYNKSGYISSPKSSYNPMQNLQPFQPQATVQNSQLRITVSQLRSALQSASENSQRMQQQLLSQRQKVYELTQLKRRLQDELQRAQFQLERIANYDTLEQRECSIKLETALRENTRMAEQINELMDQHKRIKLEQRKLMSEVDVLTRERAALAGENQHLQRKLEMLDQEIQALKQMIEEGALKSHQTKQNKARSPAKLNFIQANPSNLSGQLLQGPTHRSQHQPTVPGSLQTIRLPSLAEQEEVDYEMENTRLFEDYQKLLFQNESMKKLYRQFYKNDKEDSQPQLPTFAQPRPIKTNNIPTISPELPRSFSNHKIAQHLNSSRDQHQSSMFKTFQKEQLKSQLQAVRSQAIDEIRKCYLRSVGQAETEKKNSLKIFNQELVKNIGVFSRLAQNYLELRETVKRDIGSKIPPNIDKLQGEAASILKMYTSVKEKAKLEGNSGMSVAVFRLLTLLSRCKDLPKALYDNMQHSALKYVYKLGNPEASQ